MKNCALLVLGAIVVTTLSACGGGGGSSSAGNTSTPTPAEADYCATITSASSSSGSSSSGAGSSSESAFKQCKYDVYARAHEALTTVSGAGIVSNKGSNQQDLSLVFIPGFAGNAASTTLTVTDAAHFTISASGFPETVYSNYIGLNSTRGVFARANGGVLALCSQSSVPQGNGTVFLSFAMDYVAIATGNLPTQYQAVKVSSAADLSGVTLYGVNFCGFVDTAGIPQSSVTGSTETLTFNADGSATSAQWASVSKSHVASMLAGGAGMIGPYSYYGTLYKTLENSSPKYYFVLRDIENKILSMYVSG